MIKNKFKYLLLLFFYFLPFNLFAQDVILDALNQEATRAKENLRIEGSEKPYFICYNIYDVREIDIESSYGGLTKSKNKLSRNGQVEIRVGDYSFDNTNYSLSPVTIMKGRFQLPIEDDLFAIKYELWQITDQQYKAALDEFAQKKAGLQNRTFSEKVDDFSKEEPVVLIEKKNDYDIDVKILEQKALKYSALFKKFPYIQKSVVNIKGKKGNEYFLNTEGTKIRKPVNEFVIEIVATAIDKKGNSYSDYITVFVNDQKDFPKDEEMEKKIESLAKKLDNTLKAPFAEDYIGPVLFSNEASANFFAQLLSKSLSGKPAMLSPGSNQSQLIRKIGRKIFPDFVNVYDDPLTTEYKGIKLIGSYKVDDEGVKAQKVNIVENGVLKNLLMCRKPSSKVTNSNGHGRKSLNKKVDARPANVFISSSQPKSYEELKSSLIKMCKEMDLEYGIIVKRISDVAVFYDNVSSFGTLLPSSKSNELFVSYPIEVYKIYAKDGKEELVRGCNFANISLKLLKDIVAMGNDEFVYNFINKGNSGDLPTAFIAPSFIIDDFEIVAEKDQNKKPYFMKSPVFSEK